MENQNLELCLDDVLAYLPAMMGDKAYLSVYDDDDEKKDKQELLESCCRKLAWFQYLQSETPVVVTGVQGTGKSTLLQNLLNLPEGTLLCTEGRGERVPFLIRENPKIKEATHALIKLEKKR